MVLKVTPQPIECGEQVNVSSYFEADAIHQLETRIVDNPQDYRLSNYVGNDGFIGPHKTMSPLKKTLLTEFILRSGVTETIVTIMHCTAYLMNNAGKTIDTFKSSCMPNSQDINSKVYTRED